MAWFGNPNTADCDACRAVYKRNNEEPPCGNPEECSKPVWASENLLAWELWLLLNSRDRPISFSGVCKLPTRAVFEICDFYEATDLDFEKILLIDDLLIKQFLERDEAKKKIKQG